MEINDSLKSDYNKDITTASGAASQNEASVNVKASGKAVSDSALNSGNQHQELKEGGIIKGKVIDLRFNEVKILLEPDGNILTANLTGGVDLSIGQEAQFIITAFSLNRIVLKYIPSDGRSYTDDTILKALSAASLPDTEQNKALVRALLNNQLPIDKKTLKELARVMAMNRKAGIDTITTLYKNKLPLTTENIRQLEAYRNNSHQIINKIPGLAKEVSAMIKYAALQGNSPETAINNAPANTPADAPAGAGVLLKDIFTAEKLNHIGNALEERMKEAKSLGQTPHVIESIRDGSMSCAAAARFIIRLFGTDTFGETYTFSKIPHGTLPAAHVSLSVPPEPAALPKLKPGDSHPADLGGGAFQKYDAEVNVRDAADALQKAILFYTADNIKAADMGKEAPAADIKESLLQILNYYEPADSAHPANDDIINYLINRLSSKTEQAPDNMSDIRNLQSEIERALYDRWSIKPKDLSEKEPLVRLYKNLHEDLEKLESVIKRMHTDGSIKQPDENIRSVKENLRFMNDINELLSYVQLPVQIKDKNIHGDFYVYNRIKSGKNIKDGISTLLHLELESLGMVDIHIKMIQNQIQATFSLNEDEAGKLVATHLPELVNALSKKGYHLQARVEKSEKSVNALEKVLGGTQNATPLYRYSFDIRA